MRENRPKLTPLRCAQVTWQVLEEKILFFAHISAPGNFVYGGTQSFIMAELKGLIDDVQNNKSLYLVNLPGRWNFQA